MAAVSVADVGIGSREIFPSNNGTRFFLAETTEVAFTEKGAALRLEEHSTFATSTKRSIAKVRVTRAMAPPKQTSTTANEVSEAPQGGHS